MKTFKEGKTIVNSQRDRSRFRYKHLFDRLLAVLLLVPGLPLIGILIVLIRCTSRGPGVFRQQRVGQNGRVFWMLKLRTMRVDAEAGTGPVWAREGWDPRITPVGRMLRLLHLDELPQLINVLRGEMSMIGPRPERPEFVHVLRRVIPGYMDRLDVLPGVTGLAQINLPSDSDFDSVRRKLLLDCEYIRTACLSLDARIYLCTLLRMAGLRSKYVARWLRLNRDVALTAFDTVAEDPEKTDAEARTPEGLAAIAAIGQAAVRETTGD